MRNIHYSRQLNEKRFVGSLEFVSRETRPSVIYWPLLRAALVSGFAISHRCSSVLFRLLLRL